MALQGNLDDFSLPEILQLIAVQQKSGVLKLTAGDDVAVIFFEGGKIVSTRDRRRNARDPLKPFLVKTGRLTDAQMKQIETIEAESRRELTDILLSGNYLSSEELTHVLEQQIQDTLHQLLTWKTGSYHFSGDARTVPKFAVNVRLKSIPAETILQFKAETSANSQVYGKDDFLTYHGGGVNVWGRDDGGRDKQLDKLGSNWDGAVGVSTDDAPSDYKWSLTAGGKYDLGDGIKFGGLSSFFYEHDSSFVEGFDDSRRR